MCNLAIVLRAWLKVVCMLLARDGLDLGQSAVLLGGNRVQLMGEETGALDSAGETMGKLVAWVTMRGTPRRGEGTVMLVTEAKLRVEGRTGAGEQVPIEAEDGTWTTVASGAIVKAAAVDVNAEDEVDGLALSSDGSLVAMREGVWLS